MMVNENYDVVIVGGGLVGAALAIAFKDSEKKIALIEEKSLSMMDVPSFDSRSIALSLASINFFKSLNLWQKISPYAAAMKTIHISEKGNFGRAQLTADDFKVDSLGEVAELWHLNQVLHQALLEKKSITLKEGIKVTNVNGKEKGYDLTLEKGKHKQKISTQLLIAADGANSSIRQFLQADDGLKIKDFEKSALVCNVGLSQKKADVAYERFTKTGPLALLPLVDKRAALVWSLEHDIAKSYLDMSDVDFKNELQQHFGYRAGVFKSIGKRQVFPLLAKKMEKTIFSPGLIFIGNAAQSLHPVAGQGFNLALRDVAHLVECFSNDAAFKDIENTLNQYWQLREKDREKTIAYSEGLLTLFGYQSAPFKKARATGLFLLDNLPALKRLVIQYGVGLGIMPAITTCFS